MKKLITALMVVFLLLQIGTAFAASSNEVKTFGFTDERNRDASVNGTVMYPTWYHKGGTSYSQPLILSGGRWGMQDKTMVVSVEGNNLNGYIVPASPGDGDTPPDFKEINPAWTVKLDGNTPTKSHPTYAEIDGKKYIFIGTYSNYLDIIDITDFSHVSQDKLKSILNPNATDVTSAPLVTNWNDHNIVVGTGGNSGQVFIIADPLSSNYSYISINVGTGRTSSSPAPVPGGFAVGLDGGPNYGEMQVYYYDDILDISNDRVIKKSSVARIDKVLPSGLVSSFSVDGNMLYFGDCQSRVYAFNTSTGTFTWGNRDNAGVFSNRSPALTPTMMYFPAVGSQNQQGKVLAINRSTGATEWALPMADPYTGVDLGRAQTAPILLRAADAVGMLEGTSSGNLAIIDPSSGKTVYTFSIAAKTGDNTYANGVTGEISAAGDCAVTSTEQGIVIWQLVNTELDLAVTSLDLGVPPGQKAEPGQEYTGTVVFENLSVKAKMEKPAAVEVTHNGYAAVITDDTGKMVKELNLASGEKKTLYFKWHGPTDAKESVITATINLPPDEDLPEMKLENNSMSVKILVDLDNLWVEILDYTQEAPEGGTASIHARIHNDKGVLLTTRLVWMVNGRVVKNVENYDLIGSLDDSITFTMPDSDAVVTVEVNPDHDRPGNEMSYDDNTAGCTVKAQYIYPPEGESDVLKVNIEAPSQVQWKGWGNTNWTYKVVVTTDYKEPPSGPDKDPPPPPTITMNLNTNGQTPDPNIGYQVYDGYQKILPVELTSKKVFSSGWGIQKHTFTYNYNKPSLFGRPVTVTIRATADSSWDQSAADTAYVILDPLPIPDPELQITQ